MPIKIKIVGLGCCGSNAVTDFEKNRPKYDHLETIALDTDEAHLEVLTRADQKEVIGRELCKGQGAGGTPLTGMEAAEESIERIGELLSGADVIFFIAGLGGGTGTGSLTAVLPYMKKNHPDSLRVVLTTLPFHREGRVRIEIAAQALPIILASADSTMIEANDYLLKMVMGLKRDLPPDKAYSSMNMRYVEIVNKLIELITVPGLQNVDYSDFYTCLKDSQQGFVGFGEDQDLWTATQKALEDQLIDVDPTGGKAALLNFKGSSIGIIEAQDVVARFSNHFRIADVRHGYRIVNLPWKSVMVVCSRVQSGIIKDLIGNEM